MWRLRSLRHLSVVGACEEFIADTLANRQELETLEINGVVHLAVLPPLPPRIHTVTLRLESQTAPHEEYVEGLVCALDRSKQKHFWTASGVRLENRPGRG